MNNRKNTISIIKQKNRFAIFKMLLRRSKSIIESIDGVDNIEISMNSYKNFESEMKDSRMVNIEQFYTSAAVTTHQCRLNEHGIVVDINFNIVFNIFIIDIAYRTLSLDDLTILMDNITKHEIGHILDARKYHIGITLSELTDILEKYKKESETLTNKMMEISNIAGEEYLDILSNMYKKYHQLELENRANDYFNLSWKDFWQFDQKIIKYMMRRY